MCVEGVTDEGGGTEVRAKEGKDNVRLQGPEAAVPEMGSGVTAQSRDWPGSAPKSWPSVCPASVLCSGHVQARAGSLLLLCH